MGLLSSKGPSEDPLSCSSLRSGSLGGVSPTDACVSLNFNRRAATSKGLAFSIAHVSPSPPVDAALRYYCTGQQGNCLSAAQNHSKPRLRCQVGQGTKRFGQDYARQKFQVGSESRPAKAHASASRDISIFLSNWPDFSLETLGISRKESETSLKLLVKY